MTFIRDALPKGWTTSSIADLCSRDIDQSGPQGPSKFTYIDISSIDRLHKRVLDTKLLSPSNAPSRARQRVQVGDVLVSMTRPNLNAVAEVVEHLDGAVASTGFCVLRPAAVESKWLYHAVQQHHFVDAMASVVQGALYPAVRPKDILSYEIPVPPRAEQRRIVAALEEHLSELDAAVAGLERARANALRFRESIILNFLLDGEIRGARALDTRAAKWEWHELRTVGVLKGGITKGQKRRDVDTLRAVPYLRVANVQRGYLDLAEMKTIEATEAEICELRLEVGDVLFNEGGDRDKLGRGWVWSGELPECIHQNHVFRFRPDARKVDSKFLSYFGNSIGQRYFLEQGKQTTNLASINLTKLGGLPIPVPPLTEQKKIVSAIDSAVSAGDRVLSDIDSHLLRAIRLRQSILKNAFEGKLVPQDPNDEPVSVLLERIGAERESTVARAPRARAKSKSRTRARRP